MQIKLHKNVIVFLILILISGCASQKDALIGKWQLMGMTINGERQEQSSDTLSILEFFDDGTVTVHMDGVPSEFPMISNYKIKGNSIIFDGNIGLMLGETQEYSLEGDILTLEYEGMIFDYKRVE